MPSDHVIATSPPSARRLNAAIPLLAAGWLVTFAIACEEPDTGYS